MYIAALNFHPNFHLISKLSTDGEKVDIVGIDPQGREMFSFSLSDKRATTRFISELLEKTRLIRKKKPKAENRISLQNELNESGSDSSDPDLNLEDMMNSVAEINMQ